MIHHAGRQLTELRMSGHQPLLAMHQGRPILPYQFDVEWPPLDHRITEDELGNWFEVGFRSPEILTGTAATGWTDPHGALQYDLQRSENLVDWEIGAFTDCADSGTEAEPGFFDYWARMNVPIYWKYVVVDLHANSNRYGKSISAITVGEISITLPGFPYAMPADAATLQTDLRALYPEAEVSNVSAALSVGIINHYWRGTSFEQLPLGVTLSGSDVSEVRTNAGAAITLPSYPYAMPADQAALQADLRTAGQTGAVVKLYGDTWSIDLPDIPAAATPQGRAFSLTLTPDDPYPAWDFFGTSLGDVSDNRVTGTYDNLRPGVGSSTIPEALKAFARMKITKLP